MAAPAAWLIIVAVVVTVSILAFIGLLFVVFSHPDDAEGALVPRIVVIFGLFLSCVAVLALPYDVAVNFYTLDGAEVDMRVVWDIILIAIAVFMVVIIPFALFFYESETNPEDKTSLLGSQLCQALMYTGGFIFVFTMLFTIFYLADNVARIPFTRLTYSWNTVAKDVTDTASWSCINADCNESDETLDIEMTPTVFLIAVSSFIGWFFFILFGGVGLVALPFDLINQFRTRPQPISFDEYRAQKKDLAERSASLKETGLGLRTKEKEIMRGKSSRKVKQAHKTNMTRFENAVYVLKNDWKLVSISFELKGGNPLQWYTKLAMGVVGAVVSLMWILHIIIFILISPPPTGFLNDLFISMSPESFALPGVVAFSIQVMWLFGCVIKGAFTFGLRIPMLFKLYPMEYKGTLMNAFLVNTWILLICAIPVVHFSVIAFPIYARNTEVSLLFGSQIRYIKSFAVFFGQDNALVIVLLCISILSFCYLSCCAKSVEKEIEEQIAKIAEDSKSTSL